MYGKSSSSLKSPRLIKDMSSLVSRENEKNLLLSEGRSSSNSTSSSTTSSSNALRSSRLVQQVRSSQSEAKLLTDLLAKEEKEEDKGSDSSSDLGSDASSASASTSEVSGSEGSSHHSDNEREEGKVEEEEEEERKDVEEEEEVKEEQEEEEEEEKEEAFVPVSILKKDGVASVRGGRGAIVFRQTIEEVIGYGGDVDYSDDEDELDDDDDDDEDEDDFATLTPDERMLRRLTEKNTDFNSDNDNLKRDIEELLPSVEELEAKRKMILAEIEELERLNREKNRSKDHLKADPAKDDLQGQRPEGGGKVKLKRSPPLVTVKPLIARNHTEVRVNQVLPMKNGEVVRPGVVLGEMGVVGDEEEDIPLKGIKPKYVSREEEMVEKEEEEEELRKTLGGGGGGGSGKVTSIDDLLAAPLTPSTTPETKVTNIDSILLEKKEEPKEEKKEKEKKEEDEKTKEPLPSAIKTPPSSSVAPTEVKKESVHLPKEEEVKEKPKVPVSAPRTSLKKEDSKKDSKDLQEDAKQPSARQTPPEKAKSPPRPSPPETRPPTTRRTSLDATKKTEAPKTSPETSRTSSESSRTSAEASKPSPAASRASSESSRASPETSRPSPAASRTSSESSRRSPEASWRLSSGGSRRSSAEASPEIHLKEAVNSKVMAPRDTETQVILQDASRRHSTGAKTPSPELVKTPASRQGSNSSQLTTFGTPVVLASPAPQNSSFLHTSSSRSLYEAPYASPSATYSPATTDFLRDIKAPQEVSTPTAGIQKSALYASTSCLKGLPGAKPVITPKPPILKDKPKVAYRASGGSSPRVYATPVPVGPRHSISGAISTPNLTSLATEDRSDTASTSSGVSEASSSHSRAEEELRRKQKKPPPTTHAPAVPTQQTAPQQKPQTTAEAVYDVPVTVVPIAPKPQDDETIYHEIDDSLKATSTMTTTTSRVDLHQGTTSTFASPSAVERQASTRCQSRSTFEANRSLLSAALDFGSKATSRSSASKRPAPRPPAEEGEEGEADEQEEGEEGRRDEEATANEPEQASEERREERTEDRPSLDTLQVPNDNRDGESYSSFTDDFDDDDYEDEDDPPPLRKAERSSSAVPFYRNSIGPVSTYDTTGPHHSWRPELTHQPVHQSTPLDLTSSRTTASRSHSVPRVSEHAVNLDASVVAAAAAILVPQSTSNSTSGSSGSRFNFGRSGFFRPSSPPTTKRDNETRGRDRTKKGEGRTRFSLKKLLRLGSSSSSSSSSSSTKEEEKRKAAEARERERERRELAREAKKSRLQIIHPLDYHQDGVQVIARPEKTSPIYDYTGIYGYVPPPQGREGLLRAPPKAEELYAAPASLQQPVPIPSNDVTDSGGIPGANESGAGEPGATPSVPASSQAEIYASVPVLAVPMAGSAVPSGTHLEKKSSFLRRDPALERRESGASHASHSSHAATSQAGHLGYNSEGRPKPPPPPRKISLESSMGGTDPVTPPQGEGGHAPRPQRPPPPTRTPSNAGASAAVAAALKGVAGGGPPRPEPPRLGRDSVYANLGDVRAPITPRKPGRTSSIRGEEDREKRRAPQPPGQDPNPRSLVRHQHQDSTSSTGSVSSTSGSCSSGRPTKGPAPARPPHGQLREQQVTQKSVESLIGHSNEQAPDSAPSSRQEKTGSVSARRSSALADRSLEDQYGAVISANHEALSNMLDQLSTRACPPGLEDLTRVSRWSELEVKDDLQASAGHRLFYPGHAQGQEVTLMLTPESKVEAHHLLTPLPLAAFKDLLPSGLLSHKMAGRGATTQGTVWVLPPLHLTSLRSLATENLTSLTSSPPDWERQTCLVLLQLVTGLKHMQAQGQEEASLELTLAARGSELKGHDPDPRLMMVPPIDHSLPLVSLCQCAAAATQLFMGSKEPLQRARTGSFDVPPSVPSQRAFRSLLQLLHQERAGSLTKVKCILEVLLFGPESSGIQGKDSEEVEAVLQKWLDLERATVLHSLIRGPVESSVLTKLHLLFLVRTNARVLRDAVRFFEEPEITEF